MLGDVKHIYSEIRFQEKWRDKITNVKVDVYLLSWRIAAAGRHEENLKLIRYLFSNRNRVKEINRVKELSALIIKFFIGGTCVIENLRLYLY